MNQRTTITHPRQDPHLAAVGLLLFFLVSLWAGAMYFVSSDRDETISSSRQVAERMAVAVEEQARRQLRQVEVFLETTRLWMDQHPGEDPRSDPRFLAVAAEFRKGGGLALGFASEQGEYFELPAETGKPMSLRGDGSLARAGLAAAGQKLHLGVPLRDAASGRRELPVSLRLPANAQNLAVAMAVIDLAALESKFDPQRLSATGAVSLIRSDGTILARMPVDEKLLGKSVAQGELFRTYLPRRPRGSEIYRLVEFDNQLKVVSFSALSDFPLVVVVSATIDEVLAGWAAQRRMIFGAAAILSVIAILAFAHLFRLLRQLDERQDDLRRLATTDSLTGALNHGSFMELLGREYTRSQRYSLPMAVMMLDIDFFKRINDGYGHAVGDEALRDLVTTLKQELRALDALGRLGGEEFSILLPNTPGQAALRLADRLRECIAGIVVRATHGEEVRFTISIGVTGIDAADTSSEQMLARADTALYRAKANGRNRVEFAPADDAGRIPVGGHAASPDTLPGDA